MQQGRNRRFLVEVLFELLLWVIFEFFAETISGIVGEIIANSVNFLAVITVNPKRTDEISEAVKTKKLDISN